MQALLRWLDKISEELVEAESMILEEELQVTVETATRVQAERELAERRRASRLYSRPRRRDREGMQQG